MINQEANQEAILTNKENSKPKKSRIEFIDVAKFIGILLVVWAHAAPKNREFVLLAYTFHLPLFFLLNGYTLRIKENENFGQYLLRKLKSYVVPMLCIGSILIIIEQIINKSPFDIVYFLDHFFNLLEQKRAYALWFVGALFCSDLLFYFVIKTSKNKLPFVILISFIILLFGIYFNIKRGNVVLLWNLDVGLIGVIFVCAGYILRHPTLAKVHDFIFKKRWIALVFAIVLFALGYLMSKYNYDTYHSYMEMWARQYQKYYLTIPAAILCSYGILCLSYSICNKVLGELGKTTLVILAFHQVLAFYLFKQMTMNWWMQLEQINSLWHYFLYATVETIFTLTLLIPLHYLIVYSPFAFILNKKLHPVYKEKGTQFVNFFKRKVAKK